MTFTLQEKKSIEKKPKSEDIIIRQVKPEDVHDVSSIAYNSFRFSRFHMDPYLDNEKANLLLKTSAENSILRGFVDIMYVAEVKNKVVGYYSGKKNYIKEFKKTFGTAVITAVDSDFHGMGIFTQLDNHLLDWFALNCDFAEMGTYLGNFPVHKTWISKNLSLIRGTYQFSKLINYC